MYSDHAASLRTDFHTHLVKGAVVIKEPWRPSRGHISYHCKVPVTKKGSGLFSLLFGERLLLLNYFVVFKSVFSFLL